MSNMVRKSAIEVKKPGTILARNKDTGVIYRIRPDMLEIENHPFQVISEDSEFMIDDEKEETTNPDIIMTKQGKPFGSERTARSCMTAKKLSEDEWIVVPVGDGFVITRI
jgi:hypothetical protein